MTAPRKPADLALPEAGLRRLLGALEEQESTALRDSIRRLLAATSDQPHVTDLWTPRELASSYWLLLLSGVDQEDELGIATELLLWREFGAKASAQVACIQASDRVYFKSMSALFTVTRCPTLFVGDSPNLSQAVRLESPLLHTLATSRGSLRKLFTEIHALIEQGNTPETVSKIMQREEFLRRMKVVYEEAKGLIGFSVQLAT